MSELEKLREENRTLRALLTTANDLLAKSKELLANKALPRKAKKAVTASARKRSKSG